MKWQGMFVAATGVSIAPRRSIADAVAAGRYDRDEANRTGMIEYAAAERGVSTLDYATNAAQAALAGAPASVVADLRAIYHAHVSPPGGPPAWAPAATIHQRLQLGRDVRTLGVSMGCTIGLTVIEEALLRMQGDPAERPSSALVVASDVWPAEICDRFTATRGLMLADGGAAMVLTNRRHDANLYRVLATDIRIASGLVDATRGDWPLAYDPDAEIDLAPRFDHFVASSGMTVAEYRRQRDDLIGEAVTGVLADAGLALEDIAAYVLTHSGAHNLASGYLRLLPQAKAAVTTQDIGLHTGHLGAGDWMHGLHALAEQGALSGGDRVLMLGGAGGHVEAAVVLEVL